MTEQPSDRAPAAPKSTAHAEGKAGDPRNREPGRARTDEPSQARSAPPAATGADAPTSADSAAGPPGKSRRGRRRGRRRKSSGQRETTSPDAVGKENGGQPAAGHVASGDTPAASDSPESPRRGGRRGRRRGRRRGAQKLAQAQTPAVAEAAVAPGSEPTSEPKAAEQAPQPARSTPAAKSPAEPRAAGAAPKRRRAPAIAAIDLGTNNCRLLVARGDRFGGFSVIDAFSRVVRLGEGLNETGRLSDAAMDRAAGALKICSERLNKHQVVRFRAIATEACRRASNQAAFIARVEDETGLSLDVVAPEEEARLAVAGCAPLLDQTAEQLLVFDIGGGSTELIWIDLSKTSPAKRKPLLLALAHGKTRSDRARAAAAHIVDWISIPLGVVTLGERFDRAQDGGQRFQSMNQHVVDAMTPFIERIGALDDEALAGLQVLGTSGTITTIAGVHLNLERYTRRAVDGLWIEADTVDGVIQRLVEMTEAQRSAIPCVGADRSTHLMSGAAILRAILRAWPSRRVRVADRGLREGMLYGLSQESGGRRGGRKR